MSHKVIASLLAGLLLLVACSALGIAHYLPRSELIAGFRTIFGAFTATATGLIILTAILIGLTLVGLFLWAMGYAQQAWRILVANAKQREALAATAAAEALRAQREAELQVTVTPPGHQILVHQVAGNLEISHTPLHLAAGRVNELPAPLSPEEARRWHFYTLANATARKGAGLSAETRPQLPSPETPLPDRVDLAHYLLGAPALRHLFLGLGRFPDGQVKPVSAPLDRLVHIATGGSSGFGKSTFLLALAWQTINAREQPAPVLLDPQGVTFTAFDGDERLRYPLASNPQDILAVLAALFSEMERRQGLFQQWRGVATLAQYNQAVEASEQLPPIPIFFDEFGLVADHKEIAAYTRKLAQAGRKVGLSLIAGAQTWGADEIATALRANLATSVQFFARDKHQSRILLGSGAAAEITRPGQAFAILPGQPGLIELQAADPAGVVSVTPERIEAAERPDMPSPPAPEPTPTEAKILELAAAGESYNAIARAIYNSTGGKQTRLIKETLARFGAARTEETG